MEMMMIPNMSSVQMMMICKVRLLKKISSGLQTEEIMIPEEYVMTVIVFIALSLITFILLVLEQKIRSRRTSQEYQDKYKKPLWKQILISFVTGSIGAICYHFFFKGNQVQTEAIPNNPEDIPLPISPEPLILENAQEIIAEVPDISLSNQILTETPVENFSVVPQTVIENHENLTPSTRKARRYQRGFLQG